jgi:hypothetical protein
MQAYPQEGKMQTLKLRFTGATPLLLHNGRLADPLYAWTKELKKVSAKRKKTDADLEEMARLEWFGSLYLNDKNEVIVTSEMVEAALRDSAKRQKRGKDVSRALVCTETGALVYPKKKISLDDLYTDQDYQLRIGVKVQQSRVMRTRPKFNTWSFDATIQYDEFVLEPEHILEFANSASFGDWRPKFGQATATLVK